MLKINTQKLTLYEAINLFILNIEVFGVHTKILVQC